MLQFLWSAAGLLCIFSYFLPVWVSSPQPLISTFPDSWSFAWNLWRVSMLGGASEGLYQTSLLYHPFGSSLYLHTQVEGITLPMSLLVPTFGVIGAYNASGIVCFVLNFLSFRWLFSVITEKQAISAMFALALTFHPFFIGHLAAGHLNFLAAFPIAVWLTALILSLHGKVSEKGTIVLMGAALGSSAYLNLYYFTYLSLLSGMLFLLLLYSSRSSAFHVALGGMSGLLIASYKIFHVVQTYKTGSFSSNHDPATHSADLAYYFLPSENQWISQFLPVSFLNVEGFIHHGEIGVYLGIGILVILTLSLRTLWKEQGWITLSIGITALVFLVLSFGPVISFFGSRVLSNPLFELAATLSFFPSVPVRFGLIVVVLILMLGALAIRHKAVPEGGLWLLTVVMLVEFFPVGLRTGALPASTALSALAAEDEVKAIHDFTQDHTLRVAHQLTHKKRITSAFLARTPQAPLDVYRKNDFLLFVRKGRSASRAELLSSIAALQIQGVICERRTPECEDRVNETGLFRELAVDEQVKVFMLSQNGKL